MITAAITIGILATFGLLLVIKLSISDKMSQNFIEDSILLLTSTTEEMLDAQFACLEYLKSVDSRLNKIEEQLQQTEEENE